MKHTAKWIETKYREGDENDGELIMSSTQLNIQNDIHYLIAKNKWSKVIECGNVAIKPLLEIYDKNKSVMIKLDLIDTLGQIKSHAVSNFFVQELKKENTYLVKEALVENLVRVSSIPTTSKSIINRIKTYNNIQIKDPLLKERILNIFDDEFKNGNKEDDFINILLRIDDEKAMDMLIQYMNKFSDDMKIRIIKRLRKRKKKFKISCFIKFLSTKNPELWYLLINALADFGGDGQGSLVNALQNDNEKIRSGAAHVLDRMKMGKIEKVFNNIIQGIFIEFGKEGISGVICMVGTIILSVSACILIGLQL